MSKVKFEELREKKSEGHEERLKKEQERILKQREEERKRGWTRTPDYKDDMYEKRISKTTRWSLKWARRKTKIDAGIQRHERLDEFLKAKHKGSAPISYVSKMKNETK